MKLAIGLLGLGLLIAAATQLKSELIASYVPIDQGNFSENEESSIPIVDIVKLVLWMSVVAVSFFVIVQAITA